MILRGLIFGLGLLGAALRGNFAEAQGFLYCAQTVYCDNSTHCNMYGDMADLMYMGAGLIQNNTKFLKFNMIEADPTSGEVQSSYDGGLFNWPSYATFFTDAQTKIYALIGNNTKWNEDGSACGFYPPANATDCPLTTIPPQARR